jgi:hypothetical protein
MRLEDQAQNSAAPRDCAMKKREVPAIIVRRTKRGLAPVSAFDEERP